MDRKKILLVEDNPNDVMLIERALKKSNITNKIVVAHDGLEALDFLFGVEADKGQDLNDSPAFVLLDLHLPSIGGLEVLKRIRADIRTKLIPVVILTSSQEDEALFKGFELGVNSFIRKRVDFNQFAETIKLNLYWLALNESQPIPEKHQKESWCP